MAIDDNHAMLMYKAAVAAWRANHKARAIKLWNQSKNTVQPNFGDWLTIVGKEAGVPVMDLRKELNQELKKSVNRKMLSLGWVEE